MTLQSPAKLMPWFLLGSLVLFVLMLVVFAQDFRRPWKPYQRAFIQSEREVAETPAERKSAENFRMGIRQIEVSALGRVDRCTTCHLAVNHPDYADAAHPLRSHPDAASLKTTDVLPVTRSTGKEEGSALPWMAWGCVGIRIG